MVTLGLSLAGVWLPESFRPDATANALSIRDTAYRCTLPRAVRNGRVCVTCACAFLGAPDEAIEQAFAAPLASDSEYNHTSMLCSPG